MIEPQLMNKKKNSTAAKPSPTVKFLCSYGGKILPRPLDGRLRYVGGHTRILSVDRSVDFSDLISKLEDLCGCPPGGVTLRCQLPSEDLDDVLVSVKSDEDLANLVEEYRRASSAAGKELKVRAILSSPKRTSSASSTPTISPSSSAVDLSRSGSSESDLVRSSGVHRCCSAPNLPSRPVLAPVPDVWYGSGSGWQGHGGGAAWCRPPYGNIQRAGYYRPCYVVTAAAAAAAPRYGNRL